MTTPRWERIPFDEGYYLALSLGPEEDYVIDPTATGFQAMHNSFANDRNLGPHRKTLKAAVNDCRRDIRKRRAQLLVAGRAKL